jgi:hypothetical protein
MTINIYNAATEQTKSFKGTSEQVLKQLFTYYKFLSRYTHGHNLTEVLRLLNRQQFLFVKMEA